MGKKRGTDHRGTSSSSLDGTTYDSNHSSGLKSPDPTKPRASETDKDTTEEAASKENALGRSNDGVCVSIVGRGRVWLEAQTLIKRGLADRCNNDCKAIATE
jgi:hypothetical protein